MSLPEALLIVNADDFNLTPGVSRGILEAYDWGIVTSTTLMINLPLAREWRRELRQRKGLGVGLHLNVTFGKPVSAPSRLRTLVDDSGRFRRRDKLDFRAVSPGEIALEYRRQIELFRKIFKKLPTHLDTHHHLHDRQPFFDVLVALALEYRVPIRQCRLSGVSVRRKFKARGLRLTDRMIPDLEPARAWSEDSLAKAVSRIGSGCYELMCHPARCDRALLAKSSFNRARERELQALCSKPVRMAVFRKKIFLASFTGLRH